MAELETSLDMKLGGSALERDSDGNTRLMQACLCGEIDVVLEEVYHGCQLAEHNNAGYTPLMLALKVGNCGIASYLLDKMETSDLNKQSISGKTAMDLAYSLGNDKILEKLKDWGGKPGKKWNKIKIRMSKLNKKAKEAFRRADKPLQSWSSSQTITSKLTIDERYDSCGPGKLVIFNIQKYDTPELADREGSQRDRDVSAKLVEVFKSRNYNINCHDHLSGNQIIECMRSYSKMDHTSDRNFVCCIMAHGYGGVVIGSDGVEVPLTKLTCLFSDTNCPSMRGKPKVFIVVACRGVKKSAPIYPDDDLATDTAPCDDVWRFALQKSSSQMNEGIKDHMRLENESSSLVTPAFDPDEEVESINKMLAVNKDFLVVWSTLLGSTSYRSRKNGTFFIGDLVVQIKKYGSVRSFEEILRNTAKHLSLKRISSFHSAKSQTCLFLSSLTKSFYLDSKSPSLVATNSEGSVPLDIHTMPSRQDYPCNEKKLQLELEANGHPAVSCSGTYQTPDKMVQPHPLTYIPRVQQMLQLTSEEVQQTYRHLVVENVLRTSGDQLYKDTDLSHSVFGDVAITNSSCQNDYVKLPFVYGTPHEATKNGQILNMERHVPLSTKETKVEELTIGDISKSGTKMVEQLKEKEHLDMKPTLEHVHFVGGDDKCTTSSQTESSFLCQQNNNEGSPAAPSIEEKRRDEHHGTGELNHIDVLTQETERQYGNRPSVSAQQDEYSSIGVSSQKGLSALSLGVDQTSHCNPTDTKVEQLSFNTEMTSESPIGEMAAINSDTGGIAGNGVVHEGLTLTHRTQQHDDDGKSSSKFEGMRINRLETKVQKLQTSFDKVTELLLDQHLHEVRRLVNTRKLSRRGQPSKLTGYLQSSSTSTSGTSLRVHPQKCAKENTESDSSEENLQTVQTICNGYVQIPYHYKNDSFSTEESDDMPMSQTRCTNAREQSHSKRETNTPRSRGHTERKVCRMCARSSDLNGSISTSIPSERIRRLSEENHCQIEFQKSFYDNTSSWDSGVNANPEVKYTFEPQFENFSCTYLPADQTDSCKCSTNEPESTYLKRVVSPDPRFHSTYNKLPSCEYGGHIGHGHNVPYIDEQNRHCHSSVRQSDSVRFPRSKSEVCPSCNLRVSDNREQICRLSTDKNRYPPRSLSSKSMGSVQHNFAAMKLPLCCRNDYDIASTGDEQVEDDANKLSTTSLKRVANRHYPFTTAGACKDTGAVVPRVNRCDDTEVKQIADSATSSARVSRSNQSSCLCDRKRHLAKQHGKSSDDIQRRCPRSKKDSYRGYRKEFIDRSGKLNTCQETRPGSNINSVTRRFQCLTDNGERCSDDESLKVHRNSYAEYGTDFEGDTYSGPESRN